jgi:preprotein translocase subunit SecG
MENALLIIHLVLVVVLVAIVLLQRSEGGALGMGGGGGGGVMTGRGAATALQRATWYVAIGFLITSLALTILATTERRSSSVFDTVPATEAPADAEEPITFTPPTLEEDAGIVPAAPADGGVAPLEYDPDNLVPAAPAQQ